LRSGSATMRRMSLSPLPLSYCTNVHPGRSVAEVLDGLERYTLPVRRNLAAPPAAGLWLARPVVSELLESDNGPQHLAEFLARGDLVCYTLNAFPFGDFHSERVKENVYLPDWAQPERLDYTLDCARVLAVLLPDDTEGSISTVPLGFKPLQYEGLVEQSVEQLIELARALDRLRDETGKTIRLAIEPEPFCLLEQTDETLAFFTERLWPRADESGVLPIVQRHLGVCFDVCHQAVEFEDVAESIRQLAAAGVRINKVQITCALQLDDPAENTEGRAALARYTEPRYLHQTMALTRDGRVLRSPDLDEQLALRPPAAFAKATCWRVHFHVPVDAESLGPLSTTRPELKQALAAVAELAYAPHLEVETYTWEVLPDGRGINLVDGLTRELTATRGLVERLKAEG
ncbi:MAG: metabolite traffic protein EboE, partial [Planctomycetaceae bacterium]